jgi:hypothetical protein
MQSATGRKKLKCDKCGRAEDRLVRLGMTCNAARRAGGYCNGTLREYVESVQPETKERLSDESFDMPHPVPAATR